MSWIPNGNWDFDKQKSGYTRFWLVIITIIIVIIFIWGTVLTYGCKTTNGMKNTTHHQQVRMANDAQVKK